MLMRMVCYITSKLFAKISHVHQIVHLGGSVACVRKAGSELPPFKTMLFWAGSAFVSMSYGLVLP